MAKWIEDGWQPRFWQYVEKTDGCWLWRGTKNGAGYGILGVNPEGGIERAHRLSWILHHGPIPRGLCVCHHCDVPACVNPDHLFLGTHKDNARDAMRKGRAVPPPQRRGEANNRAKLTAAQVAELRRLYAEGLPPKRKGRREFTLALAQRYGIDRSQVNNIASGRQWVEGG